MSQYVRGRLILAGRRLTTVHSRRPRPAMATIPLARQLHRRSSVKVRSSECCWTSSLACYIRYDERILSEIAQTIYARVTMLSSWHLLEFFSLV